MSILGETKPPRAPRPQATTLHVPASSAARLLVGTASVVGQIAAAAAGALSWPVVLICAPLTMAIATRPPVKSVRWRQIAGFSGLFVLVVVGVLLQRHAAEVGLNPAGTLRRLTAGLAVLSVLMGSIWGSVREYRSWLAMSAISLIAAAANGVPGAAVIPLALGWLLLIAAAWVVQADAVAAGGSNRATVTVDGQPAPAVAAYKGKALLYCLSLVSLAGWLVYLVLPGQLGGGGLGTSIANAAGLTPKPIVATRGDVGVDTTGTGFLDLTVRGSLPDTPLISVPATSPQLWQATVYQEYTGESWDNPFGLHDGLPPPVSPHSSGSTETLPIVPDDPPAKGNHQNTAKVRILATSIGGAGISVLWSPGVPLRFETAPTSSEIPISILRTEGSWHINAEPSVTSYTVTTAVPPMSPKVLEAAGNEAPVHSTWTELPKELPNEVRQLAQQITANSTTIYGKVTALENYLRTNEKYSLSSPVPGPGQDAVDRFLFHDHVGFCEQFASAETVMLRALGIPARLVTGLAYGDRSGHRRVITEADAHAWTEVEYPGIGWVPTDPTAGVALAPATTPFLTRVGHQLSSIINKLPGGGAGLLTLVVLVLVIGLIVWLRLGRSRSENVPTVNGPVLMAFLRFTKQERRPAETARDFVTRAVTDRVVLDRAPLDQAVGTLEQEIYGDEPPDADDVSKAVDAFTK